MTESSEGPQTEAFSRAAFSSASRFSFSRRSFSRFSYEALPASTTSPTAPDPDELIALLTSWRAWSDMVVRGRLVVVKLCVKFSGTVGRDCDGSDES